MDTLHCKTPLLRAEQLVEVHGHLGSYKCINAKCARSNETLKIDISQYDKRCRAAAETETETSSEPTLETSETSEMPGDWAIPFCLVLCVDAAVLGWGGKAEGGVTA